MGSYSGVIRTAARRAGVAPHEYVAHRAAGLKFCGGCRDWLDELSFGLDKNRGDGLAARCRDCKNRRARELHYPGKKR